MGKKKIEPVVMHRVYTGFHAAGSSTRKNSIFGRCTCGATLEGQDAIDEHRALVDGPAVTAV